MPDEPGKVKNMKKMLASIVVALFLGGCFTSEKPLIAPAEAEFPISTPREMSRLFANGTKTTYRLDKRDGAYVLAPAQEASGENNDQHRFVLRGIGDGLFLAQQYGVKDQLACPCVYGLVQLKDNQVAVHEFEGYGKAPQLTPEEMVQFGVSVPSDNAGNYVVSSFDKTAALFRALLARPRPDSIYEIK